jgi:hypothetical protein
MKHLTFLCIALVLFTKQIFTQEKKTPDTFNGFRNIEFYKPITDYYNYNYKKIYSSNFTKYIIPRPSTYYEIILPFGENQFLGTHIKRILIEQYKNKIFKITLILESDVSEILSEMFKDSYPVKKEDFLNLSLRGVNTSLLIPDYHSQMEGYASDEGYTNYDTIIYNTMYFNGYKTKMDYGHYMIIKTYRTIEERKTLDNPWISDIISWGKKTVFDGNYLTFEAVGYEDKINSQQVKEHYDTYMSDFGTDHYPKENENKASYKIPLFESNNIYYVRALFGDIVENLVFDTGADQLIIGKTLYEKLKNKKLVTDQNSTLTMIMANGTTADLKKVMISNLQLYDLKIDYIEAYVNTAAEISLLGQSFLKRFGGISVDYKTNVLTIKK